MNRSVGLSFLLSILFTVFGVYFAFGVLGLEMNLVTLFIVVALVFSFGIGVGVLSTRRV